MYEIRERGRFERGCFERGRFEKGRFERGRFERERGRVSRERECVCVCERERSKLVLVQVSGVLLDEFQESGGYGALLDTFISLEEQYLNAKAKESEVKLQSFSWIVVVSTYAILTDMQCGPTPA